MNWHALIPIFVLVFFVLVLPSLARLFAKKQIPDEVSTQPRQPPPTLKAFSSIKKEARRASSLPPPKELLAAPQRIVEDDYTFHDRLEDFHPETAIEKRELDVHVHPDFHREVVSGAFRSSIRKSVKLKKHYILERIEKKSTRQKMIIYSELMQR